MGVYYKESGEKLSARDAAKMEAINKQNPDLAWNQDRSSVTDLVRLGVGTRGGVKMPRNSTDLRSLEKRASSALNAVRSGVNAGGSDYDRRIAAASRVQDAAANLRTTQNNLREDGRLKAEKERINKASDYMESFTSSPGYDKGQVVLKDGMINKLASFANLDLPITESVGENGERSFTNKLDGQVVATRETSENGRNWWKYSLKKTDADGNVTMEPIKQANGQPMMFDEGVGKELANRKRFISEIESKAANKKDRQAKDAVDAREVIQGAGGTYVVDKAAQTGTKIDGVGGKPGSGMSSSDYTRDSKDARGIFDTSIGLGRNEFGMITGLDEKQSGVYADTVKYVDNLIRAGIKPGDAASAGKKIYDRAVALQKAGVKDPVTKAQQEMQGSPSGSYSSMWR